MATRETSYTADRRTANRVGEASATTEVTVRESDSFEERDLLARQEMCGDLGGRATRSAGWRGVANVATALIRVGVLAVLARKLAPSAFGVVAMSAVVTGFAGTVAEFGIGSAIIQRPRLTSAQLWWVFKLNLGISVGVWGACAGASPWVARFFHEPLAGPVLAVSAAMLPISASVVVPQALLTRYLEFRKLTACSVAEAGANGVVAIALVFAGLGVWSIVVGSLAGTAARAVLLFVLSPWRPVPSGAAHDTGVILRFGAVVAGIGIVNYWAYSADKLVVGRMLDSSALGVYNIAFVVAMLPIAQLTGLASAVAFPAFSAVQHDKERLRAAYLRCIRWSAALAFPCCAIMAALAPEVVSTFLGPRWQGSVLPLRLLLAVAAARSLYTFAGSVLRSVGRPKTELLFQVVFCAGVATAVAVGARSGVNGVAAAVAAFVCCVAGPLFVRATARAAGAGLIRAVLTVLPAGVAAAIGGALALAAARLLVVVWPGIPAVFVLAVGGMTGASAYALMTYWLSRDFVADVHGRLCDLVLGRRAAVPASVTAHAAGRGAM